DECDDVVLDGLGRRVVLEVRGEENVCVRTCCGAGESTSGATTNRHVLHRPARVTGGADAPRRGGQSGGRPPYEVLQCNGPVESADPTEASRTSGLCELDDVPGRFLVRVCGQ